MKMRDNPERVCSREMIEMMEMARAYWVADVDDKAWRVYVWVADDIFVAYARWRDGSWNVSYKARLPEAPADAPAAVRAMAEIADHDKMCAMGHNI